MSIRKFLAASLLCLCAPFASATTISTDFTDMWWIPAESGWGANVIQQGDTLFVTLFVYGANNQPTWYVSPATTYQGAVNGAQTFIGPLYQVTGPYFGAPVFDPNTVNVRQVGSLTFGASLVANATIAYTADGVNVTKAVVRQTWRTENLAGTYYGATSGTFTGCASNGMSITSAGYGVTQNGNAIVITEVGQGYTCTYNGTLTQTGRMGSVAGTGTCSDQGGIDFVASEVRVDLDSLVMRMNFTKGTCRFSGRMGGIRQ